MSQLYWDTVTENMRTVLSGFTQSALGDRFYLAGGTALSLQLGHRISIDLDFFSQTEDIPSLRPQLEKTLAPFQGTLADSAWGNLAFLVKGVRIGFYGYGFPLVAPLIETKGFRLASIEDIALMKLPRSFPVQPARIFTICISSAGQFPSGSCWIKPRKNTHPFATSNCRRSSGWFILKIPKTRPTLSC